MNINKPSLFTVIIALLLLITPYKTIAQYFIIGQDPASIKWKQLNSDYFQIIFPDGYQAKAQEYINLLELSRKAVSYPYLDQNKKFKIVLHNRTVTSNAMVSPTPMHADFFEMLDQSTYAQTWAKQLTLHEYRHAVQMQTLNQGTTKALKFMLGEQAIGGIMGIFLPFWFIEGDAVFSETIYANSGRGRSPNFSMDLVAQVIDKKIYSYDKAIYGSFKNYTPDHYTLGYELVTFGNLVYGQDLWKNTLNKVARKPYTFVPFTSSIKNVTGSGKVKYYTNVLEARKTDWLKRDSTKTNYQKIKPLKDKFFTDYRFINPISDGSFIVEKTGIDDINRFIKVYPDGTEEKLFTPGYDFKESLSANDSLICWNEKTYDPRWSNRDYSVIKLYNFKTKKLKQITRKTRLFAPTLSNDATKIVAVNVSETGKNSLQILDIASGEIINEFATPNNLFFTLPSWSDNDRYIVSTVVGDKGKSIILVNTTTWDYEIILPFSFVNINRPIMVDNNVIYSGSYTGTSDIYMFKLSNNETYKITNARFGATEAAVYNDNKQIAFTSYTANGFRIATIPNNINSFEKVNLYDLNANYLIDQIKSKEDFNIDNANIPTTVYDEKKYSKSGHLFNIHSWGLAAVDLNNYDFQPGVNILTQNTLSTAYGTLGYYYDPNENAGKTKIDFTYAGWYPVVNIAADYGLRRINYQDTNKVHKQLRWMETNLKLSLSLPLNLTRGVWIMGLRPYTSGEQKFLNKISNDPGEFSTDQVTSLTYGIYAYTQYKRSKRDIYPKWGFNTNIFFKHTPFAKSVSTLYGWAETFYFPGIVKHHGIRIYSAYQVNQKGIYSYSNMVSTPRGYSGIHLKNTISLKAEYALPIIYPDLNLQAVAYLKRISAHVFYDYLTGESHNDEYRDYSSTGIELYSDWNFFSLIPNIRLGMRSTYFPVSSEIGFEFLYGFSIN